MATYSAPVLSENNHKVYIDITETTNVASNTSSISWKVYYKVEGNGSYFHYNNGNSLIVKLNGTEYYNGNPGAINVDYPNSKDLTSGNFTFSHNSDGSGSFSVYVYFKQSQKTNCTATINTTFTCTPIKRTFTVTYHGNGGYGSMENSTATLGSNFKTSKNTFTKPGHAFNGWKHTAPNGEEVTWHLNGSGMYESGIPWTWTYEYDVKLYAQWIPAKDVYDITFDGNGGEIELIEDSNIVPTLKCSKNKNSSFSLSNIIPMRLGYTFKYWLAKQSDTPILIKYGYYQEYNDKDNNAEPIKSVWMKRISSDGTSHGTDGWEILVNATNCSMIKAPTWTTYNGQNDDLIWHELGSGNWERNEHNFNFGTWIETRNHKDELIDYITHLYAYDSYGNQLGTAYSVGTGSYSVEFYPENSYSYNQDVTLYAHWEANIYDITINLENGNINGDSSPIVLEEALTFDETSFYSNLADYIPVKPSYEFDGFYDSEGIKVYDKEGNTVESKYWNNDGQYIHAGDLILYAHWKPLNLAYYNSNGKWVLCNSYVKDNGIWKPAIMNLKTEQDWITIV